MSGEYGLPNASEPLLSGQRMAPRWYESLARVYDGIRAISQSLTSLSGDVGGLPTFGTAATKNYGTSGDAVPLLNTVNTWSKAQAFSVVALTDDTTITWDWTLGPIATVTLGGNRTLAAPSSIPGAGTWALIVTQDGTGSRTLAYAESYIFPGGTDPVLSTGASAVDLLTFVSDGTRILGAVSKAYA